MNAPPVETPPPGRLYRAFSPGLSVTRIGSLMRRPPGTGSGGGSPPAFNRRASSRTGCTQKSLSSSGQAHSASGLSACQCSNPLTDRVVAGAL